jgi:predicted esterase
VSDDFALPSGRPPPENFHYFTLQPRFTVLPFRLFCRYNSPANFLRRKIMNRFVLCCGWLLMGLPFVSFSTQAAETGFLNRTVTIGGERYRYQVYVPANWKRAERWPVILFLHGSGERGDDGLWQTEIGLPSAIRRKPERFPAIVVMPQCRRDTWWNAENMQQMALRALEQSVREFHGDSQRLYLTGLSMGAYGTWSMARHHPGKFAAFLPICGGIAAPEVLRKTINLPPDPTDVDLYALTAQKVGKAPVWIFHGDADTSVPVSESRKMHEALKAAGASVRYMEYPGVGHNSWDRTYNNEEAMKWLLAQKLQINSEQGKANAAQSNARVAKGKSDRGKPSRK